MKVKVELYINDQLVDIENEEKFAQQFAITYSFSDLSEPDKIVDTYSKTINLPGTSTNNKIFANIWKLDSDNIMMFNPSQMSDFRILLNSELWQTGTVQLKSITQSKGVLSYNITLFGKITQIMSILLNGDIEDDKSKLLRNLNFPTKLRHPLTKSTIASLFDGTYYNGSIYINDYLRYIPCQNGTYEDFDNAKKLSFRHIYEEESGSIGKYYTCVPYMFVENRINSQVISNDSGDQQFDEYMTHEYRVEYQRPALKINKLIEQIISDASTDASIYLDSSFFNDSNPYWNDTWLTLSQYTTEEDRGEIIGGTDYYSEVYVDTDTTSVTWELPYYQKDGVIQIFAEDSSTTIYFGNITGQKTVSLEFLIKVDVMSDIYLSKGQYTNAPAYINGYCSVLNDSFSKSFTYNAWNVQAKAHQIEGSSDVYSTPHTFPWYYGITNIPTATIYPLNKASISTTYYNFAVYNGTNENYPNNKYVYTLHNNDIQNRLMTSYKPIDDPNLYFKPFKCNIDVSSLDNTGTISIKVSNIDHRFVYINDGYVARQNKTLPVILTLRPVYKPTGEVYGNQANNYYPKQYGWTGNDADITYDFAIRSGVTVTTKDMLDTTTTQGQILLDYCKLLGILFETDNLGNVYLKTRNKFFENYKILDWSDKVDYSKKIEILPLTFDTRMYEMKLKDGESYYEDKYRDEFGIDYGEKRINTGYAFNSEPKQLFNVGMIQSVIANEPSRFYYIDNMTITSYPTSGIPLPCYFKKDGDVKTASSGKYGLLFSNGYTSVGVQTFISEDSSLMMLDDASTNGGSMCWLEPATGDAYLDSFKTSIDRLPLYTTHKDNVSWDLGYPRISYDKYTTSTYSPETCLFSRFWESYITEIYNVNNKIMTCKVKLTWNDMIEFSFRNFVSINGTLWHVNKIKNFNPLSDDPVEVELIKVTNIEAYISGQRYNDII